jgi:hypothetical protein
LVGEAQDFEATDAEILIPVPVMSDLLRASMNVAVELDNEPPLVTAEIGDVVFDRELSSKLQTQTSTPAEQIP